MSYLYKRGLSGIVSIIIIILIAIAVIVIFWIGSKEIFREFGRDFEIQTASLSVNFEIEDVFHTEDIDGKGNQGVIIKIVRHPGGQKISGFRLIIENNEGDVVIRDVKGELTELERKIVGYTYNSLGSGFNRNTIKKIFISPTFIVNDVEHHGEIIEEFIIGGDNILSKGKAGEDFFDGEFTLKTTCTNKLDDDGDGLYDECDIDCSIGGNNGDYTYDLNRNEGENLGVPGTNGIASFDELNNPNGCLIVLDDEVDTYVNYHKLIDVLGNDLGVALNVIEVGFSGIDEATEKGGKVTIEEEGKKVKYIPDIGYLGEDSFEYTVSDGVRTGSATVNLNVGQFMALLSFHPERLSDYEMEQYDALIFARAEDYGRYEMDLETINRYRNIRPDGIFVQYERWDITRAKPLDSSSPMPSQLDFVTPEGLAWNPDWVTSPRQSDSLGCTESTCFNYIDWPLVDDVRLDFEAKGFDYKVSDYLSTHQPLIEVAGVPRTDYLPYKMNVIDNDEILGDESCTTATPCDVTMHSVKLRLSENNYQKWKIAFSRYWQGIIGSDMILVGSGKRHQYWDDDLQHSIFYPTPNEFKRHFFVSYNALLSDNPPFVIGEHYAPSNEKYGDFVQGLFDIAVHPDLADVSKFCMDYNLAKGRDKTMVERYPLGRGLEWWDAGTTAAIEACEISTFSYSHLDGSETFCSRGSDPYFLKFCDDSREIAQNVIDSGNKPLIIYNNNVPDMILTDIPYVGWFCFENICNICKDGKVQVLNGQGFKEECDDGNIIGGDGCSPACELETDWSCDYDIVQKRGICCKPACGIGEYCQFNTESGSAECMDSLLTSPPIVEDPFYYGED